jgi:ABC-type multidrug transport system fused ATPase/permease subunit
VTLVSQDVALFSGSVRSNLDPFDEYTDEECWDVLERCHLGRRSPPLNSEPDRTSGRILLSNLDTPVSAGGKGLSAGQRQLLALARAMLRRSALIIMDEATSSIDLETDDQVGAYLIHAPISQLQLIYAIISFDTDPTHYSGRDV